MRLLSVLEPAFAGLDDNNMARFQSQTKLTEMLDIMTN